MKISAVHLNNFKSYRGIHKVESLDNSLDDNKNIILIGGLNGAGKTSFLEALVLCFYGKGASKLYPTRGARFENYQSFVESLLNKEIIAEKSHNLIQQEFKMSVEIFLSEVNFTRNVSRDISIYREWNFILKNDIISHTAEDWKILDENREHYLPLDLKTASQNEHDERRKNYNELIDGILPYDISQFFFFDGEKIQEFAADADEKFEKSLKSVLGIGLYDDLYKDLEEVKSKIIKDYNNNKEAAEKLAEKELEAKKIQSKVKDNLFQISQLEEDVELLIVEEEKIRYEAKRITNVDAESTEDFRQQRRNLEDKKVFLENRYIELSKIYMPFILTYNLCKEVEKQVDIEERFNIWQATEKALFPKLKGITEAIFEEPPYPDLTNEQRIHYENKIMKVLNQFLSEGKPSDIEGLKMIHKLSSDERRKIKDLINLLDGRLVDELVAISTELKDIDITLERIRSTEVRMDGKGDEVTKVFDNLSTVSQQIGAKKTLKSELFYENSELEREIKEIKKSISEWTSKAKLHDKHQKQIDYCNKLRSTIKAFTNEFQSKRIKELEDAILDMWKKLARKKSIIKSIKIEIDKNFDILLFDKNDRVIDKTKISAGEKEIYAICLLSALVKVSGRKIPIVIDTPYGRLDSKHRKSLAKSYFSNAGEQVFILSQDEEIVGEFYDIIKPYIAKELSIEHNQETNQSQILEGYSFN